jgi:hypothetical protein
MPLGSQSTPTLKVIWKAGGKRSPSLNALWTAANRRSGLRSRNRQANRVFEVNEVKLVGSDLWVHTLFVPKTDLCPPQHLKGHPPESDVLKLF